MNCSKRQTIVNAIGGLFFVLAVYFLVRSVILAFSIDIWYDELFTMEFVTRPIGEMLPLAARDVHPPLYYMIVRFFVVTLGSIGLVGDGPGQIAIEVLAKLVSVLPFAVLMAYALGFIRKRFGMLAAGIFSFAMVTMPQLPEYTTEIRMYSWAILFVTGMMIHGYLFYGSCRVYGEISRDGSEDCSAKSKSRVDVGNILAMWLYAAAAAYTHYYAALSAGIIFGMLFLVMLFDFVKVSGKDGRKNIDLVKAAKQDDRKNSGIIGFGMLILCMVLTAVTYIPWISVFFSQASAVKENYWIQPVGIRSLGSAVKYLFKGYFQNETTAALIAVLMFIIIAALFIRTVLKTVKEKRIEDLFTVLSFLVLPLVVTGGLLASLLLRPVFVNRYMLPAYGCFWMSVSIMVSREIEVLLSGTARNKETSEVAEKVIAPKDGRIMAGVCSIAAIAMVILMTITGFVDFNAFIGNEEYRKVNMEKTLALFDDLSSDTIIISNFTHVQGLLSYYLNRKNDDYRIYLYQEQPEALIGEMVPGLETIDDPIDIANYLGGGKKVLFLGSFNSREVLLGEWEEELGIKNENQGSYLMERYWFDVFKLKNY